MFYKYNEEKLYVKLFKLDLIYYIIFYILYYYTTSMILKENEIQLTMKANKQEIEKWKKNIDESLNYTITIKDLNKSQHTYCSESKIRFRVPRYRKSSSLRKKKHRQTSKTFYGESQYYCVHQITNHRETFTYYIAFKTHRSINRIPHPEKLTTKHYVATK